MLCWGDPSHTKHLGEVSLPGACPSAQRGTGTHINTTKLPRRCETEVWGIHTEQPWFARH